MSFVRLPSWLLRSFVFCGIADRRSVVEETADAGVAVMIIGKIEHQFSLLRYITFGIHHDEPFVSFWRTRACGVW
jgi:hypothetical protein